jgi:hypothetical protein
MVILLPSMDWIERLSGTRTRRAGASGYTRRIAMDPAKAIVPGMDVMATAI